MGLGTPEEALRLHDLQSRQCDGRVRDTTAVAPFKDLRFA